MTTTYWSRAARRHAVARNRSLRRARHWQSVLRNDDLPFVIEAVRRSHFIATTNFSDWTLEQVHRLIVIEIRTHVALARQAHRAWRMYRRFHLEHINDAAS